MFVLVEVLVVAVLVAAQLLRFQMIGRVRSSVLDELMLTDWWKLLYDLELR